MYESSVAGLRINKTGLCVSIYTTNTWRVHEAPVWATNKFGEHTQKNRSEQLSQRLCGRQQVLGETEITFCKSLGYLWEHFKFDGGCLRSRSGGDLVHGCMTLQDYPICIRSSEHSDNGFEIIS